MGVAFFLMFIIIINIFLGLILTGLGFLISGIKTLKNEDSATEINTFYLEREYLLPAISVIIVGIPCIVFMIGFVFIAIGIIYISIYLNYKQNPDLLIAKRQKKLSCKRKHKKEPKVHNGFFLCFVGGVLISIPVIAIIAPILFSLN
ncbi:MAG: hypothetical protein LBM93_00585 [Oscillospiraceae bacterium]|jgi:vacuolar-type H+-ATPase subunit I/STV1|nr:hypothetical protein [Oscillospiraceae bacterium]